MDALTSLKSLSAYPVPSAALLDIAEGAGLAPDTEMTQEVRQSASYRRAKARVYLYLADAPNVSQGGISFSFSEGERNRMRKLAEALLDDLGESNPSGIDYGYQGEDL